ncbi:MAG: site-specific integrase [Desulfobacterales bacterium]|nr:site-specific integrase [Desulfobacterales bacterium]
MKTCNVIDLSRYREDENRSESTSKRLKKSDKGSIYARGGKLWVNFRYLGERVREGSGLSDTKANRKLLRRQLDLIVAEIENGVFRFAKRFPQSRRKVYFAELEGETVKIDPSEVTFSQYLEKWWQDMRPGMSESQIRDYESILKAHLVPQFGNCPFSDFWSMVRLKKFIAELKSCKNRYSKPLSGKRIQNIMIPLRVIVHDAVSQYEWHHLHDPFAGLKLPKARKFRVQPFDTKEWKTLLEFIPEWYHLYFKLAVQTGLRPSEQVALKWEAIDDEFIHIERSRVRNREKEDLKNEFSRRMIGIRPSLLAVLQAQRRQIDGFDSPYVFINTQGRPILQDKLREVWMRAMVKSGLQYRRMYETRHTYASWALASGETPEWVARTLGHADTAMIYRTYGRYIPNLTRNDGSAFEKLYAESTK